MDFDTVTHIAKVKAEDLGNVINDLYDRANFMVGVHFYEIRDSETEGDYLLNVTYNCDHMLRVKPVNKVLEAYGTRFERIIEEGVCEEMSEEGGAWFKRVS